MALGLYSYPGGPRRYLSCGDPHTLLPSGRLHVERMSFNNLQHMLCYWAHRLYDAAFSASIEAIVECPEDNAYQRRVREERRRELWATVADESEMVLMLAEGAEISRPVADAMVHRSLDAGREAAVFFVETDKDQTITGSIRGSFLAGGAPPTMTPSGPPTWRSWNGSLPTGSASRNISGRLPSNSGRGSAGIDRAEARTLSGQLSGAAYDFPVGFGESGMPWEPAVQTDERRVEERKDTCPAVDEDRARRLAARRFYREAPPYCIRFEDNGTVTLRRKRYEYWDKQEPEEATTWPVLSTHDDLEEAERRLRLICSASIYYDAEGRPTKPPRSAKPRWGMPPPDDD
jgi:hypothetical protein